MSIIQNIKNKYKRDKMGVGFMGGVLILSILTFIRPDSPLTFQGIAAYAGTSLVNLLIILLVIGAIMYFIKNK